MTTTHETPYLASEDDDKHRQEILAHLFDTWAFEHIDTTALTVDDVVEDSQLAHNDLHRDEE
jgi:hypothetical protein